MKYNLLFALVGASLLAGCLAVVGGVSPTGHASLTLQPSIKNGIYSTQAIPHPYTQADIYHLQIKLFTVQNKTETPVVDANNHPLILDVPNASLSASIDFSSLHPNTTYRVRAYAYSDPATASLISTLDSRSYVDVAVTDDTRPTMATLPVQLMDQTFNGEATASEIVVASGSVLHNGNETLN